MKYYSDITKRLYETREQLFKAEILQMKYYSDITKQLHETREQLSKAEWDYKMELIAKARADEKTRKIADIEAQIAELNGETTKANKPLASEKSNEDNTTHTKVHDAGKENEIDYSKTIEAIKKMIDDFKVKYPSFGLQDVEDDKVEKTAPTKINGTCGNCSKCVKTDTDGDKKRKLADSGYYSSAYINLNGKEFYSEGADSWNDVKKAVREYFDNKKID